MRSETEVNHAVDTYADMVRRVCFYHLKNQADTEDVFQEVFLKYMLHDEPFKNKEHEKAWLLRVAINACKDYLKNFFRRNTVSLDSLYEMTAEIPESHREVLEAVLSLPGNTKTPFTYITMKAILPQKSGRFLAKRKTRYIPCCLGDAGC